jgi:hypothetical protein
MLDWRKLDPPGRSLIGGRELKVAAKSRMILDDQHHH